MVARGILTGVLVALPSSVRGQTMHLVYPVPAAQTVTVVTRAYRKTDSASLEMDVFRPATVAVGRVLPVLIIFNGYGGAAMRVTPTSRDWAAVATAHGFAAVTAETTPGRAGADFDAEVAYLVAHADSLRIDPERIAVIAWSGNAATALPVVEDSGRTRVRAAAMYYGAYGYGAAGPTPIAHFRLDAPVLFVETGLDAPGHNPMAYRIIDAGLAANAPIVVLNYPSGHHGFDVVDDNDVSRAIIDQTFAFFARVLSKSYQATLRAGLDEASAAGAVGRGDYADAVARYAALAQRRPTDPGIQLTYGTVLLLAKRYHDARAQFEHVKALGTAGPHDLGVLGAEASVGDNDPEAAIAWLKSIPPQSRSDDVRLDSAFVSLRDRPDFQALFQRAP